MIVFVPSLLNLKQVLCYCIYSFMDLLLYFIPLCIFISFVPDLESTVTESAIVRSKASASSVSIISSIEIVSSRSSLDVRTHRSGNILCLDLSIGRVFHCSEFYGLSLL